MKFARLGLFVLAIFGSLPAFANVIYTWHTLTTSDTITSFDSQIVISDDAYFHHSASIDWVPSGNCYICPAADDNGILSISFWVNDSGGGGRHPGMPGGVFDHISLSFDYSGFLSGFIEFNTSYVELAASGGGKGWGVSNVRGDPLGAAGCSERSCGGITGYYFADALPVPEPMPLTLLAVGVVAIIGARKIKRDKLGGRGLRLSPRRSTTFR